MKPQNIMLNKNKEFKDTQQELIKMKKKKSNWE